MNKLKIEDVRLDIISNNPWNSNVMSPENEEKLMNSIKRNGSFKPILLRKMNDGTYQILGGEHRAKAAKRLGHKTIPAIVHENLSDNAAKEISIADNARYGSDDALLLSELVSSLDDPDALSDFLPYSDAEVETLLSSTNIDLESLNLLDDEDKESDSEDINLDQKSVKTHVIMRFKIPIEDSEMVKSVIEKIINDQEFTGDDSLTNAGDALVYLAKTNKK